MPDYEHEHALGLGDVPVKDALDALCFRFSGSHLLRLRQSLGDDLMLQLMMEFAGQKISMPPASMLWRTVNDLRLARALQETRVGHGRSAAELEDAHRRYDQLLNLLRIRSDQTAEKRSKQGHVLLRDAKNWLSELKSHESKPDKDVYAHFP